MLSGRKYKNRINHSYSVLEVNVVLKSFVLCDFSLVFSFLFFHFRFYFSDFHYDCFVSSKMNWEEKENKNHFSKTEKMNDFFPIALWELRNAINSYGLALDKFYLHTSMYACTRIDYERPKTHSFPSTCRHLWILFFPMLRAPKIFFFFVSWITWLKKMNRNCVWRLWCFVHLFFHPFATD